MMRDRIGIRILLCSCLVVLFSGCSLINPHVTWGPPAGNTLDNAIDYANTVKDRYKKAVRDQSVLTNSLALGLIPAGALALGLGTHPGNADTILALGLGGASAYAVGSWLSSKPRQLVYINGIKAIDCAIKAMLPLSFPSDQETAFNSELNDLGKSITSVTDQIIEVERLVDQLPPNDPDQDRGNVIAAATKDLATARTAVESARTAYASGVKLALERDRAGHTLIVAIDDIGAEVDRAIVSTLPDLQALPGIVSGLAQMSTQLAKVSVPKGAGAVQLGLQGEHTGKTKELNDAKRKLNDEVMKLQNHGQYIASVVNSVRDAMPESALKQCGVEAVPSGLNTEPASVQFQPGKSDARRILVSGGKPPYTAEMEDAPSEGFTVTSAPPWVVLQATDKITAGTYTLLVTDTASNAKAVSVTVGAGTQGGKLEEQPSAPASPTIDQQKQIASALCLPTTEPWGSDNMVAGIKIFQATIYPNDKAKATGQLTQGDLKTLMQSKPCKGEGRRNYYENTLTEQGIKDLQTGLKVKETGQLDDPTRNAIKTMQQEQKLTPSDGTLTSEIVKKIKG